MKKKLPKKAREFLEKLMLIAVGINERPISKIRLYFYLILLAFTFPQEFKKNGINPKEFVKDMFESIEKELLKLSKRKG